MGERILIIEDDDSLRHLTRLQLQNGGYEVAACHDGTSGLAAARDFCPDLILLDILLPRVDGWEVCRQLRSITQAPIIFMTALGADADLQRGLELGADDYIIKPFGHAELWARVRAALHRARRHGGQKGKHRFGRLTVDLDARTVHVDQERVLLTPTEYELLALLVENGGRVVSHAELLRRVWGPQFEDRRQYLKLYICYLRQKIERDPAAPQIILTERGVGYRLAAQAESEEP